MSKKKFVPKTFEIDAYQQFKVKIEVRSKVFNNFFPMKLTEDYVGENFRNWLMGRKS